MVMDGNGWKWMVMDGNGWYRSNGDIYKILQTWG